METIITIITGGIGGSILVWLLRGWISERLKQSIQHEYAQRLETHKAELNSQIQLISHQNQLNQLRTSLFFDHQREAFAKILGTITDAMGAWWTKFDVEEGRIIAPIPFEKFNSVENAFYSHQLFLDGDCRTTISLALDYMRESFPIDDGNDQLEDRDYQRPYEYLEFIQGRLVEIFQEKIGFGIATKAKEDVALLGAIRLVNNDNFLCDEIEWPAKGALKLTCWDKPAIALSKAESNRNQLIKKLEQFIEHSNRENRYFPPETSMSIIQYLKMLGHPERKDN